MILVTNIFLYGFIAVITLIGVMFFLSSREYQMIFSMQKLINFLMGTAFVLIVIGCIMVYKEYKDIRA